jgi:hypothetical protein
VAWLLLLRGNASIVRLQDALVVTDPSALSAIMGRGEGAMDKASLVYAPINKMCDPHGSANLLTSSADDTWKVIRKAVAISFSMQVTSAAQQGQQCWQCFQLWSCQKCRLVRMGWHGGWLAYPAESRSGFENAPV